MRQKQERDIDSMIFFSKVQGKVTEQDKEDYLAYSNSGVPLKERAVGVEVLMNGKMYREAHIAGWQSMINEGTLLKEELLEDETLEPIHWLVNKSLKDNLSPWIELYVVGIDRPWAKGAKSKLSKKGGRR